MVPMPEATSRSADTHQPLTPPPHGPELATALQAFIDWRRNPIPAELSPENPDETFTVAFWNIQRIPFAGLRNPDYRRGRLDVMMNILGQADIAAIAEQFMRAPNTDHPYRVDDNQRQRMRLLPPGSRSHGLNISADMPLTNTQEGYYSACGPNNADCRVRKGFIITQLSTPRGPITVVTTHLDSGNDPRDHAARAVQLTELGQALEAYAEMPLILMGDMNLTATDAAENAQLMAFLDAHGLTVNARQTGKGHDIIASRGLELVNTMEYDAPDLTDHPLEMARFRLPSSSMQQPLTVTAATR